MADEGNQEISLDELETTQTSGKEKLIIIIIIVAVVVLFGATASYFLLTSADNSEMSAQHSNNTIFNDSESAIARYVAMPRPFVFNVMDDKRNRLVQIKVQLMVRGLDNENLAKKHIPLLESTLVSIFGAATVEQLRSPAGKEQLRESALEALNESTTKRQGKALINAVLFTGFVLQ